MNTPSFHVGRPPTSGPVLLILALVLLNTLLPFATVYAYEQVERREDYVLYNFYDTAPQVAWRNENARLFGVCPEGDTIALWVVPSRGKWVLQLVSAGDGTVLKQVTVEDIMESNSLTRFKHREVNKIICMDNGKLILVGHLTVNDTNYQAVLLDTATLKAKPLIQVSKISSLRGSPAPST